MADQVTMTAALDAKKRVSRDGVEYWTARDICEILNYSSWQKFRPLIQKARQACITLGLPLDTHFNLKVKTNMVMSGPEGEDYFLTRHACYLIAMQGENTKPEIAVAQIYFAVQTVRQEEMDQMTEEDRRIYLRDRVKDHNRQLQGAAKTKGVERYGVFIGAGYRGMYEAQLDQIKRKKKIADSEQLLDCIGDTELAANDFRATQTAEKLRNDPNIRGERMAIDTHEQVGRKVRQTMIEISSVKPEDLPRAKNLKLVERERKRKLREGKAKKLKE